MARGVCALALALTLAGCNSGTGSDGASTTSATPVPSTPTVAPMTPVPPPATQQPGRPVAFRDYLASIDVTGEPARFDKAPGLSVTVPVPDGWARTPDPLFATGIEFVQPVGSDGSFPSVTLMAIKLIGAFDPKDAIRHANTDALPPNATDVTESYDDYDGFPSAAAQGVAGGVEHYSRIVLADVPSTSQRYLVQMTVTTRADQAIAQSPQLSAIVAAFKVEVS
jgi:Probable lipoprotein LpqN